MQKVADITTQDNRFLVTGDLHYSNVMSVYEKSLQQILSRPEWIFDFSRLNTSDSSGFALIVEWIKLAKQQKKPIQFVRLSDDIMAIAKAAGLDGIFNGKHH